MRLSEDQVQQYMDDGFLLVEDVFTADELRPVMDEFEDIVDEWAERLSAAGKIGDKHEGEDLYTRLASLEKEWSGIAPLIHNREQTRPGLAKLWSSDNLLDMVEQFIGPDISGHPVSVVRTKTPNTPLMTVPWHQDAAYFEEGAEKTLQPTAWIPFTDVSEKNGTLQVIRGSHKTGKVFPHRPEKETAHPESWYIHIEEEDLPPGERVVCEMKMGSMLWHRNNLVHRSTENTSDKVRWSVDIRYQNPGKPTGLGAIELAPMRKSNDPSYRLDWEEWMAHQAGGIQTYRKLDEDDFGYSAPDAPWLVRWENYWAASAQH